MLATVRNRRGIVSAVEPFDGPEGRVHLVTLEYTDGDGVREDRLIWEREPKPGLVSSGTLPRVTDLPPMPHGDFDALVRATRWSALTPFLAPEDSRRAVEEPATTSPFHGAVEVDDFQLVPVLKALRMPRISLLLADDVGLGKTIEAGLILTELLLRRRIRRVLILCPASLRTQWQEEMKQKFSIDFDPVDREETHRLRRSMGMDANPWRTYSRIVASYYYLRQPDVLEDFLAFCRNSGNQAQLPWDLLIVDEAHNLSPAPFGEDSDLSKMLERIAPYFEHKIFLTATPHNGHTRSFTGLLERLDPMRFTQSSELKGAASHTRPWSILTNRNDEIIEYFYASDGSGDLIHLEDGKNNQTHWTYDSEGRVDTKKDDNNVIILDYGYDAEGRLTSRWSKAKGTTTYSYDAAGNLTFVNYPTSPDISYGYDAANRLTNMVDGVGTSSFDYNANDSTIVV